MSGRWLQLGRRLCGQHEHSAVWYAARGHAAVKPSVTQNGEHQHPGYAMIDCLSALMLVNTLSPRAQTVAPNHPIGPRHDAAYAHRHQLASRPGDAYGQSICSASPIGPRSIRVLCSIGWYSPSFSPNQSTERLAGSTISSSLTSWAA
jgi:hypothetical protein